MKPPKDENHFHLRADPRDRGLNVDAHAARKHPRKEQRASKRKPWFPKGWGWRAVRLSLMAGIWGAFLLGCMALWYGYDLPDINNIPLTHRRASITILAENGTKLATYGDLHGEMVKAETLPPHVIQALLAIEDRRFYSHFGIDIIGLLRAVWVNSLSGHVVQGGSTITQQLAKNFLLTEQRFTPKDRSLRRKIQEAMLALWLEHKFTKNQILTMYLNRVYLGSGTFGIDAAARHYFGKPARNISLYEAAVLAGLLKAPTRYSPANSPELADQRAKQVLESMVEAGFISDSAKEAALMLATASPEIYQGTTVRYFCDWVVSLMDEYIGLEDKDLIVTTTLNTNYQKIAENHMLHLMAEYGTQANTGQLALVSLALDGAVKAMIGGVNYKTSKFNRATQALRQPGSIFKTIVFLSAIEDGLTPWHQISDLPIRLGKWQPKNYRYQARGEISLQDALAYSVNTVTVRLAHKLGINKIVNVARRLGINSTLPDNLSIVLGSGETTLLELTSAYAVFANGGKRVWPYAIQKIQDAQGTVFFEHEDSPRPQLIEPQHMQYLQSLLSSVIEYGTGKNADIGRPAAGKTGTSQLYRDFWFIGYTPQLITGVWSGNDNNTSMKKIPGGSLSIRLWKAYMKDALSDQPVLSFVSQGQQSEAIQSRQDIGNTLLNQEEDALPPAESLQESKGLLEGLIDNLFGK